MRSASRTTSARVLSRPVAAALSSSWSGNESQRPKERREGTAQAAAPGPPAAGPTPRRRGKRGGGVGRSQVPLGDQLCGPVRRLPFQRDRRLRRRFFVLAILLHAEGRGEELQAQRISAPGQEINRSAELGLVA